MTAVSFDKTILDFIMAWKGRFTTDPPVVEQRFGQYRINFHNGDVELWSASKVKQMIKAWNKMGRG